MIIEQTPPPTVDDGAAVRKAVAVNMRRARLARGVSLRELSAEAGISAGLLSQIEREAANPTIAVLTRIAAALDFGFADLTRVVLSEPEVLRAPSTTGDRQRVRTLFDHHERRRFDISEGYLPAHTTGSIGAHGKGSVEYAYIVKGEVMLRTASGVITLSAGDSVKFDAGEIHGYFTDAQPVTLLTVVTFMED